MVSILGGVNSAYSTYLTWYCLSTLDEDEFVDGAGLEMIRVGFFAKVFAAFFIFMLALTLRISGFTERVGPIGLERLVCFAIS